MPIAETTDTDTERMAAIRNQGGARTSGTSAGGLITEEMEEENDEETNEDDDIYTSCWDQRLVGKKKMKKQTTLTGKKKRENAKVHNCHLPRSHGLNRNLSSGGPQVGNISHPNRTQQYPKRSNPSRKEPNW